MWTSPMELKCLLMWLLFGFIKGSKRENCPDPPRTEFADVSAKAYVPGTKMYYACDKGYDRKSGHHPGIQCNSGQQGASWDYSGFECIDKKTLLSTGPAVELHFTQKPEATAQSPATQKQEDFSEFDKEDEKILSPTAPTMELEFTQKPEIKTRSTATQKQEDLPGFAQKDFCDPPKNIPHASVIPKKPYYVGQVLHFKCQSGYDKRLPTSGTSTCKKVNGNVIWTPLDVRCANDSNPWPPQTIESDPSISTWCQVQSVPGSTHPSPSSCVTLPVTAICFVLLVIPAVFV